VSYAFHGNNIVAAAKNLNADFHPAPDSSRRRKPHNPGEQMRIRACVWPDVQNGGHTVLAITEPRRHFAAKARREQTTSFLHGNYIGSWSENFSGAEADSKHSLVDLPAELPAWQSLPSSGRKPLHRHGTRDEQAWVRR
jgi:hypothetical protein